MNNSDHQALRIQLPEADLICPRIQLGGHRGSNLVVRKAYSGSFSVMGDYPEIMQIEPIDLYKGRFLNLHDLQDKRKVCIIGDRVQQMLFDKGEDPIGDYIRISGAYFQVVGICKPQSSGDRAERQSNRIYCPFTTFQQAFNYGDELGWFAITAKPPHEAAAVEAKARKMLHKRHRVHPDDRRAFGSWNAGEEFQEIENLFTGIELLLWIVGIGTLLAGTIGVSNIMLIIVKERTKEIGVKRALGARPGGIVLQIILEAVMLTALAGYVGLVLGVGLNAGLNWMLTEFQIEVDMYKNPGVDLFVALKALAVLIFAGVLAGLLPSARAVSIKPVDALRAE